VRSAVAVLLLALATVAHGQVPLCAADLDADGEVAQSEQATCLDLPGGPLCPLQQVACIVQPGSGGVDTFACPLNPALPCVDDGNGGAACSPHACFVRSTVPGQAVEPPASTPTNTGPRDAAGMCLGDLQIFAGDSTRCRRAGVETAFQNCCAQHDDVLQDSGGSRGSVGAKLELFKAIHVATGLAVAAGPAAANAYLSSTLDPKTVAVGLASGVMTQMLIQRCDSRDLQTALMKDSGYCVSVGSYCAERWPLVGCVQRAESHCCFNSKLARIVQEQGRAQLPAMGGFGTPEEPNCRGFRAVEFQALDFSKIDLSEYFEELEIRGQSAIEGEIRSRVEERL